MYVFMLLHESVLSTPISNYSFWRFVSPRNKWFELASVRYRIGCCMRLIFHQARGCHCVYVGVASQLMCV